MGSEIGKLFGGGLTQDNSALQFPSGGMSLAGPAGALQGANQSLAAAGPPTNLSIDSSGAPQISQNPNLGLLPKIIKPTFQQASTDKYGNAAPINASETKGGKLLAILRGGLQGGLDAAASGALDAQRGRSNFGAGIQGAMQMPFMRAQQRQAIQQGETQQQLEQAQIGNLPFQRAAQVLAMQKTQAEIPKLQAEADANAALAKQRNRPETKTLEQLAIDQNPGAKAEDIKQKFADVVKNEPPIAPHVTYDAGIPVSVTGADKKTYDVNDPKLPLDLKPLVDAATRAHGQHLDEETKKQAAIFAQQQKMHDEKQEDPTATTKSMREAAPGVITLATRVKQLVNEQANNLGPAASRWSEYWAGNVGSPNPEFTKLRTNTMLLTTKLLRMHLGARGGEQMMDHFKSIIDFGKQSPENMNAALDEIIRYAHDTQNEGKTGKQGDGNDAGGITIIRDDNGRITGVK